MFLLNFIDFKAFNEHNFHQHFSVAVFDIFDKLLIFGQTNDLDDQRDIFCQLINLVLDWHAPQPRGKSRKNLIVRSAVILMKIPSKIIRPFDVIS